MAYFFGGVTTNSVSTLFSSVSTKNNSMSGLTSMMSDYYSIRSGSYKKLLNAYYNAYGDEKSDSKSDKNKISSNLVSKDSATKLSSIKSESSKLSNVATDLVATGKDSIFKKVESVDKDGKKIESYDTNKIYEAVNKFVNSYNQTIDEAEGSNVRTISNSRDNMITRTKYNEKLLKSVGITVNSDNSLSINEKDFKSANMSTVKSLFNTVGSYGYSVATQASSMNASASYEATKANTYTSNGLYSASYTSGSLYNSIF
ncbi:MAG: hypothetical protein IJA34_13025 [Lachnospiraceae bacterium]|nr:hypothetical protein [Lachnospiraceae bacterium]